jgi:hypothetical protein
MSRGESVQPRQVEANGKWVDIVRVSDAIQVKGRSLSNSSTSSRRTGVVVASDRQQGLLFTVVERRRAGRRGVLAALCSTAPARGSSRCAGALKMPAEEFVHATSMVPSAASCGVAGPPRLERPVPPG